MWIRYSSFFCCGHSPEWDKPGVTSQGPECYARCTPRAGAFAQCMWVNTSVLLLTSLTHLCPGCPVAKRLVLCIFWPWFCSQQFSWDHWCWFDFNQSFYQILLHRLGKVRSFLISITWSCHQGTAPSLDLLSAEFLSLYSISGNLANFSGAGPDALRKSTCSLTVCFSGPTFTSPQSKFPFLP